MTGVRHRKKGDAQRARRREGPFRAGRVGSDFSLQLLLAIDGDGDKRVDRAVEVALLEPADFESWEGACMRTSKCVYSVNAYRKAARPKAAGFAQT